MTTIVVEQQGPDRHWSAWFEGQVESSFAGQTPYGAVERLVRARLRSVDPETIEPKSSCDGRLEFIVRSGGKQICPDCGGSRTYVGLHEVEPCERCGGNGSI